MRLTGNLLIPVLVFALSGCAWLRTWGQDPEVRLTTAADVQGCIAAGSTRVSLFERSGEASRSDAEIARELAVLARRSAVQLGGNTIVPVSGIVDGSRTFAIYRCRR